MYNVTTEILLDDLRYSLLVMEEKSHLGLDDEAAEKLKRILERTIERIEMRFQTDR